MGKLVMSAATLAFPGGGFREIRPGQKLPSWSGRPRKEADNYFVGALELNQRGHLVISYTNGQIDVMTLPVICHYVQEDVVAQKPEAADGNPENNSAEKLESPSADAVKEGQKPPSANRTSAERTDGATATGPGQEPGQPGGAKGRRRPDGDGLSPATSGRKSDTDGGVA